VDRIRLSGLEVDVRTDGDPDGLPVATRLALYRIVQESLTNVVKHAKAKQAAVRLDYAAVSRNRSGRARRNVYRTVSDVAARVLPMTCIPPHGAASPRPGMRARSE
jgi:two-component sensor histidine kinase